MKGFRKLSTNIRIVVYGVFAIILVISLNAFATPNENLLEATEKGNIEDVRSALKNGADVNAQYDSGVTALMIAARTGRLEIVEGLLDHKADVNATARGGFTALIYATSAGYTKIVQRLLEKEADIYAQTPRGQTALILATQKGYTDIVRLLQEKEALLKENTDKHLSKNQYSDPKGHFVIVPPEGWQIEEFPHDPRGNVNFNASEPAVALSILASATDFKSFDELFQSATKATLDIKTQLGIDSDIQTITFLGRTAIQMRSIKDGMQFLHIQFMDGNISHGIQYMASLKLYDKYLPIVMKAMETYEPIAVEVSDERVKQDSIMHNLRLGIVSWQKGDLDLALKSVQEGLLIDPQNQELLTLKQGVAESYYNRGLVKRKSGRDDQAINDYTQAIALNPKFTEAYMNRGFAYMTIGQHEQAIRDYTQAIVLNPKYVKAYYNRRMLYMKLEQYQQALNDSTQILNIEPNGVKEYFLRGAIYIKLGKNKEAVDDLNTFLKIAGNTFGNADEVRAQIKVLGYTPKY